MLKSLVSEWSERSARHKFTGRDLEGLPAVAGDERLLRRSIEEVLDNAVKFSPEGGAITLEANVASDSNDGRMLEVSVSDEGIGIPPDDLPHIFSDFHQIDASETRSFGGLGLGLALVHRIVSAHQGEVRVESELDRGTRLTIAVPVAKSGLGATK
jgi:signal transduction histidine kinase